MAFHTSDYSGFIAEQVSAQRGLFSQYSGANSDFELIIIGSGMGGGILADRCAELYPDKRILVLEGGSFLYPTHVYNTSRFLNYEIAKQFAVDTFSQYGDQNADYFIGEKPQLNFGGRSIFWSGLIPATQEWELDFFPPSVRNDLMDRYLEEAGELLNQGATMGAVAKAIVETLNNDPTLAQDFIAVETPRALHQPYLMPDGTPRSDFFQEPTGVFNTAELLINQSGPVYNEEGPRFGARLNILLNHFVETIDRSPEGWYGLTARNTLNGQTRTFWAPKAIIAAGSLESPKVLQRASFFNELPESVKAQTGFGLTDHPTTRSAHAEVDSIGAQPITKTDHAKILLYSKGLRDAAGRIVHPYNIEMNINHEFWHLRNTDPEERLEQIAKNDNCILDLKFSFANCLDHRNRLWDSNTNEYVKGVQFRNHKHFDFLAYDRFNALANWDAAYYQTFPSVPGQSGDFGRFCSMLNSVANRITQAFSFNGSSVTLSDSERFGRNNESLIGYATVHHAIGTLRMPFKPSIDSPLQSDSVVNENLMVKGADNLYVCDMSVLPFSSAANPVRTLAALSLRLAEELNL